MEFLKNLSVAPPSTQENLMSSCLTRSSRDLKFLARGEYFAMK